MPSPADPANPATVAPSGPITVTALILKFLEHAGTYYRRPDEMQTTEVTELRPTRHLFGHLPVTEFGPKCLRAVRSLTVDGYLHPDYGLRGDLSRGVVNQRVGRIVRVFKWGVSEELVPATVHRALTTVTGLKAGRTEARETEPVEPVAWEIVEKTLPKLNPVVRAMVLLQWHTGMRPGEVCSIRADEIDRTAAVWIYRPTYHKLAYRGKPRVIAIGKQGQDALAPFMDRPGYLFSPVLAVELMQAEKRANRKSKVQPSQRSRNGSRGSDTRRSSTTEPSPEPANPSGSSRGTPTNYGIRSPPVSTRDSDSKRHR